MVQRCNSVGNWQDIIAGLNTTNNSLCLEILACLELFYTIHLFCIYCPFESIQCFFHSIHYPCHHWPIMSYYFIYHCEQLLEKYSASSMKRLKHLTVHQLYFISHLHYNNEINLRTVYTAIGKINIFPIVRAVYTVCDLYCLDTYIG